MTPKRDPATDISPYYKGMGFLILLGTFGLQFARLWRNQPFTWIDFGMVVVAIVSMLGLIRPTAFDAIVRRAAAWLPWTKYGGDGK